MGGPKRKPDAERLAIEAAQWDSGEHSLKGWVDAPEAVPMAAAAQLVSIRLPKVLLATLREFAAREGIGYQVLIKQWLDDRIQAENRARENTISLGGIKVIRMAATFDSSVPVRHVGQGDK